MKSIIAEVTPADIERIKTACSRHTPDQPTGYLQWHAWAARMLKTHRSTRCEGCGLYMVWVPKKHLSSVGPAV